MNPLNVLMFAFVFLIGYVLNVIDFGAGNDVLLYTPALFMLVGLGGVIWAITQKA